MGSSNILFFFFSSRRRHTRCSRDWSSDVCSSDLQVLGRERRGHLEVVVEAVLDGRTEADLGAREQLSHGRSEEHTSELQSRLHLVCRLLLEKKKKNTRPNRAMSKERSGVARMVVS